MFSKPLNYVGLVSVTNAFVRLANPVPFASKDALPPPLNRNGSDFPCGGVDYTVAKLNTYEAGSSQELSFKGANVLGGGSCQVSITTDLNPTKSSVWKVIKSIEGGCPARDAMGALPAPDSGDQLTPFVYNFTIPDLQPGRYTLAWTWFNKIGNREMYMACAPLELTGGTGGANLEGLPDMFVANIDKDCSTIEGSDVLFPDPGQEVEQLNGATTAFQGPQGSECTGVPSPIIQEASLPTDAVECASPPSSVDTRYDLSNGGDLLPPVFASPAKDLVFGAPVDNPNVDMVDIKSTTIDSTSLIDATGGKEMKIPSPPSGMDLPPRPAGDVPFGASVDSVNVDMIGVIPAKTDACTNTVNKKPVEVVPIKSEGSSGTVGMKSGTGPSRPPFVGDIPFGAPVDSLNDDMINLEPLGAGFSKTITTPTRASNADADDLKLNEPGSILADISPTR